MKLIQFHIEHYRVLRNLWIQFSRTDEQHQAAQQGYALDFLAGVNGTGKSTVLRLLGKLFTQLLTENYYFPIPVELTYTLKVGTEVTRVTISNLIVGDDQTEASRVLQYRKNDENWRQEKLPSNLLPQQIIFYTTGSEQEWLAELEGADETEETVGLINELDEADAYIQELPGHRSDHENEGWEPIKTDNPILFIYAKRLPLVALCGLIASRHSQIESQPEILYPVLESIGLETLAGFSLRVRVHPSLTHPTQQEIVNRLANVADHIIRQGSDRLFVFNTPAQIARRQQQTPSIFTIYDSPIILFQHLNALYEHQPYYDPPLQGVNLFLRRSRSDHTNNEDQPVNNNTGMLHLFDWLSDGEQSFLGRMALFALFRTNNLLILLDEPEVHFNDVWKREIVNMLDKIMGGHASHALITTHSSIALTDVRPQDILVLRRQGALTEGQDAVRPPGIETLGADPSDILVHVFGTRSASGERSIRFIREEIARRNTTQELEDLEKMVAPGYWRYRIQLEMQRLQRAS